MFTFHNLQFIIINQLMFLTQMKDKHMEMDRRRNWKLFNVNGGQTLRGPLAALTENINIIFYLHYID